MGYGFTIERMKENGHWALDIKTPSGVKVHSKSKVTISDVFNHTRCGLGSINHAIAFDELTQSFSLFKFTFCHLQKNAVVGEYGPNSLLSVTNNTGHSTGAHLHVQIMRRNNIDKRFYNYILTVYNYFLVKRFDEPRAAYNTGLCVRSVFMEAFYFGGIYGRES